MCVLEYTTCHRAAALLCSPVAVSRTPPNGKETLRRFNKWRKVLGLSLISLHFANMFDLSDSEIYRKISAVGNQKVKETSRGNNSKRQLRTWRSERQTKVATEPFLFKDFDPFCFCLVIIIAKAGYRKCVNHGIISLLLCSGETCRLFWMHRFSSSALTEKMITHILLECSSGFLCKLSVKVLFFNLFFGKKKIPTSPFLCRVCTLNGINKKWMSWCQEEHD